MTEAGTTPEDQANFRAPTSAVLAAELKGGKQAQLIRELGLEEEDARMFLQILDWLNKNRPQASEGAGQREIHTDDDYRPPTLAELVNGGGSYLMPAFPAEKAQNIQEDDDMVTMSEKGMLHILTPRQPLGRLLEQLPNGEQVLYRDISVRTLEMSVLRGMIESAQVDGDTERIASLAAGFDTDELLKQGEEWGIFKPAKLDGLIDSDADFIRSHNADPTDRLVATLRKMEGGLGALLAQQPAGRLRQDTFLPHQHVMYASAFGRYCNAKSAPAPQPPVL